MALVSNTAISSHITIRYDQPNVKDKVRCIELTFNWITVLLFSLILFPCIDRLNKRNKTKTKKKLMKEVGKRLTLTLTRTKKRSTSPFKVLVERWGEVKKESINVLVTIGAWCNTSNETKENQLTESTMKGQFFVLLFLSNCYYLQHGSGHTFCLHGRAAGQLDFEVG